jgi:hypothetical protein
VMSQYSQGSAEGPAVGAANSQWVDLGHGIRLYLEQCDDGWRWRGWEQMTRTGWRALPAPATQDLALRFSTQPRAEMFFQRLVLLLLPHTGHGEG